MLAADHDERRRRIAEVTVDVVARDPTDIVGSLFAMTAAEERAVLLWRVHAAFLDRAGRDSVIAELQRRHMNVAIKRIAEIVRARSGERSDLQRVSQRLNALAQGISLQALIDGQRWSAERIRTTLADEVELVLGKPTTATMSPRLSDITTG